MSNFSHKNQNQNFITRENYFYISFNVYKKTLDIMGNQF